MTTFTVIENTPGYLPEADEPATFDTFPDALIYAAELAEDLAVDIEGQGGIPNIRHGFAQLLRAGHSVKVYDTTREHDLGRVVEIVEDGDGA